MSGPVVAIGYILLIPPLIGMVVSALMLFGVITYKSNESTPTGMTAQYSHGGYDDEFRHACGTAFAQSFQKSTGTTAPPILIAEYCECALSSFKGTNSETDAAQICKQQYLNGSLIVPDQEVQDIYSKPVQNVDRQQAEPSGNLFRVLGGSFAIFLGISSFVSGLLGWLLIMKKRVLKCSVCGAIVNAS